MARPRREPAAAQDAEGLRRLCGSVAVMLHNPLWCGHAHTASSACDSARIEHPPAIEAALRAARARAHDLAHGGAPISQRAVDDLLLMIPERWRADVARNAADLRAMRDEFDERYGHAQHRNPWTRANSAR
jgi:hypothetical protein